MVFRSVGAQGVLQPFDRVEAQLQLGEQQRAHVMAEGRAPAGLAVHAFLEMRFRTDSPPGFALGSFKAGDRVRKRFCGFYKLRDGKICGFRVFPFLGE